MPIHAFPFGSTSPTPQRQWVAPVFMWPRSTVLTFGVWFRVAFCTSRVSSALVSIPFSANRNLILWTASLASSLSLLSCWSLRGSGLTQYSGPTIAPSRCSFSLGIVVSC